jgi:hypothetical protein
LPAANGVWQSVELREKAIMILLRCGDWRGVRLLAERGFAVESSISSQARIDAAAEYAWDSLEDK